MKRLVDRIKDIKIKSKLVLLTGFLTASLLLIGIISAVSMQMLNSQTKLVTDSWLPSIKLAGEMNTLTSDYRVAQYGHMTTKDDELKKNFETKMENYKTQIIQKIADYEAIAFSDENKKLIEESKELWQQYVDVSQKVVEYSNSDNTEMASQEMLGNAKVCYETFQDKYAELIRFNENGSEKAGRKATSTYYFVLVVLLVIVIVSILVSYSMSKMVIYVIATPLEEIKKGLTQMSQGNLDACITYESKDELGVLANSLRFFIDGLVTIIKDEKRLLSEMAEGNFDIQTEARDKYIGDFEIVLSSMKNINRRLDKAMSGIAESANQINVASEQMAIESQNLAEGATEQAGSVQELLTAVEDVTSQASDSADKAAVASQGASGVRQQAEQSNQQMTLMIEAMDMINSTSKEISSIIDAIESIASQTNLLSLNASIEAARAGEAGKGFAVVANEIGKLALQCSEAASNTRRLIETEIAQAKNGDSIAKETAEALSKVTEGIENVVKIVDEVKVNCNNQEHSMEKIEKGIQTISKVVENNSAAAEESSATSEELSAHAENLHNMLSGFTFRKE